MIEFAGVNPLIPTPELEQWVNAHLPLGLAQYFTPAGGGAELSGTAPAITRNTWGESFQPKVNCLYWPTGASRWACMLLLVDSDMVDTIISATSEAVSLNYKAVAAQLKIADSRFNGTIADDAWTLDSDDRYVGLSTQMYALTPHPVADHGTSDKKLYVLPIVDARYWWQWVNIGDGIADPPHTWSVILDHLNGRFGPVGTVTLDTSDTVPAGYGTTFDLWTDDRKYAPIGLTLDSLARMIGMRFVRNIDGSTILNRYPDAGEIWDGNVVTASRTTVYGQWDLMAGGEFSKRGTATIPQKVRVVDNRSVDLTVNSIDVGATYYVENTEATIFAAVPSGVTASDFKTAVANDWIGWRRTKKGDLAYCGVKAWDFTGYEDVAIFEHRADQLSTRIITLPENLGIYSLGGGSATKCVSTIDFRFLNFPASGNGKIDLTYNSVTEEITFNVSSDLDTDVKTAIDAHSEFVAASKECTIAGGTGRMNGGNVLISLPDGATADWKSQSLVRSAFAPYPQFVAWETGPCG